MPNVVSRLLVAIALLTVTVRPALAQTSKTKAPPANPKVIAIVLGNEITTAQKDRLNGMIFGQLLERFAKENKIAPTDKELDEFVVKLESLKKAQNAKWRTERKRLKAELKDDSLSAKDRKAREEFLGYIESILKAENDRPYVTPEQEKQNRQGQLEVARMFVQQWKINQGLFRKHGGRVIFQQVGPEPLDAYRRFLRDHERKGNFKILDKEAAKSFWNYFENDKMHVFASKGQAAEAMNTPWWKKDPAGNLED
jgi:hypothetical protein